MDEPTRLRPIGRGDDEAGYRQADIDVTKLRQLTRGVMRLYEQELRALNVAIGLGQKGERARMPPTQMQLEKLRAGLAMLTDDDLRKRRSEIVEFLARCSRGTLEAARAHETIVGGMDDQQLQATMRAEFLRSAHTWTDEEWAVLDEIRLVKRTQGVRAAELLGRKSWHQLAAGKRAAEERDE